MILISHPRSGSTWFMQGLIDYKYPGFEILNRHSETAVAELKDKSIKDKLRYLEACNCQKIHGFDITRLMGFPNGLEILNHLKRRSDLYFLERRNKQRAIISAHLAIKNDYDYHGAAPLKIASTMTRDDFLAYKNTIFTNTIWARNAFNYVESLVYEDLLEKQYPKTLRFDPGLSKNVRRDSHLQLHLLENIDEVRQWMYEHRIPGHI